MSLCAIIPVAGLIAANASLQAQGFGPGNFSVPAYTGPAATHAALHTWPNAAFVAAVKAIPAVVWQEGAGDPITRTKALIEAQGAKWGAQSPELPSTGNVTAGNYYNFDGSLWYVITGYSRTNFPAHPATLPALICRVRPIGQVEPWSQPLYQFNAFKLLNPFTGKPDETLHAGKTWVTSIDNNVNTPGTLNSGWYEKGTTPPVAPPVEEWPAWRPWTSGLNADLYQVGAKVTHGGFRWIANTGSNHWEPGTFGWVKQP